MYNNLENLLEMIETKHEIDMLIENALDNMSTQELEMLTEKGLVGRAVVKGKRALGLLPNADDINVGRVAGLVRIAGQKTGNIGRGAAKARLDATNAAAAKRLASNIALGKKVGKVAGAGALVGGVGVAGYGMGKDKGQKQGINAGLKVGAELARRQILAQIKAETDAKRKASLINRAKNLFGMGE